MWLCMAIIFTYLEFTCSVPLTSSHLESLTYFGETQSKKNICRLHEKEGDMDRFQTVTIIILDVISKRKETDIEEDDDLRLK